MLHDPSHYEPPPIAHEIEIGPRDTEILRRLASELAGYAALPVHAEKARLWQELNDLRSSRPMVWINEIPWHEMNVDDELTLRTEDPWAQDQERELRRTLYQWRHLPADMVLSDHLACPLAIHSTDFGIVEDVEVARTDDANDIVSREFHIQIRDFDDLEKIRMPQVTHNEAATEFRYRAMCEVYEGILPVRKTGQTHIWYTPWDYLIRWWGVEEAMLDLVQRPDLVHAGVDRMVDAWMTELDQFEAQDLLSLDANNTRIGSGGYGYTEALPGEPFDPDHVRAHNMWGCSNAQIFSEVSPADALGVRGRARHALADALGHDLLRLLRAPGQVHRRHPAHPQPAQDLDDAVGGHRTDGRAGRHRLRAQPQAEPGRLRHRRLASRAGQGGAARLPRAGSRLPRRADHEGHLHRPIPAAAALGVGRHGHGGGPGLRHLIPARRARGARSRRAEPEPQPASSLRTVRAASASERILATASGRAVWL